MKALITTIRTLTILPVPGKDTDDFARSLYWFPVIGLLLGGILYAVTVGIDYACREPWAEGTALLLLLLSILLTRGLHLDGLCDWADGFWGSHDRDGILAIMKDSSIGTFGGAALVCILLAKWVCLVRLIDISSPEWIIAAFAVSRSMQVIVMSAHPYARTEGGTAENFVKGAGNRHRHFALFAAMLIALALCGLRWQPAAAVTTAWVATCLVGQWSQKKIGGVTGDITGTTSEITEALVLATGAIFS